MSSKKLGELLRNTRENKGWTLEDSIRETRIKAHYLQAMEEGRFDDLPSPVQVRGFLRSYASALGLDSAELLQMLETDDSRSSVSQTQIKDESEDAQETTQADAIFQEMSAVMKARREMLGLSLEDVAQFTRIPEHYLSMIERAAFDEFPSPVQARGMLGNYANFLEMDRNAVLLNFAEGLQAGLADRQATTPATAQAKPRKRPVRRLNVPPWLRNLITPDVITAGVVATAIFLFFAWAVGYTLNTFEGLQPTPTARGLADSLLATHTPVGTPTPESGPTPTLLPDTGEDGEDAEDDAVFLPPIDINAVQVFIIVRQRTWLRVTVDDKVIFEGRVQAGINLPYSGNDTVQIRTGNAAALQIFYNDRDMGVMGIYGEVVDVVYTKDGLLVPTALPSPTIDPALLPTETQTPTPAP